MKTIENAVTINKKKVVVMAHSMGNLLFHFFLGFGMNDFFPSRFSILPPLTIALGSGTS